MLFRSLSEASSPEFTQFVSPDPVEAEMVRGLIRADTLARAGLHDELTDAARRAGADYLADPSPRQLIAYWQA